MAQGNIVHHVRETGPGDLGNLPMPGSHDSMTNADDIEMQDHKMPSKLHKGGKSR